MAKTQDEEQNERFTLFTRASLIAKLDHIARKRSFDEAGKITRTDLVNGALEDYVMKWEKKNGEIPIRTT